MRFLVILTLLSPHRIVFNTEWFSKYLDVVCVGTWLRSLSHTHSSSSVLGRPQLILLFPKVYVLYLVLQNFLTTILSSTLLDWLSLWTQGHQHVGFFTPRNKEWRCSINRTKGHFTRFVFKTDV